MDRVVVSAGDAFVVTVVDAFFVTVADAFVVAVGDAFFVTTVVGTGAGDVFAGDGVSAGAAVWVVSGVVRGVPESEPSGAGAGVAFDD